MCAMCVWCVYVCAEYVWYVLGECVFACVCVFCVCLNVCVVSLCMCLCVCGVCVCECVFR